MVTLQNYSEETAKINFAKQPDYIQEAHKDFADYAEFYNEDKDIKEMLDNHMKLVDNIIKKEYERQPTKNEQKKTKTVKKTTKNEKKQTKTVAKPRNTVTKKSKPTTKAEKCNKNDLPKCKVEPIKTEHYTEDVRLIRRFAGCIGKERQRRTILTIYRDFERRITERKVTRKSRHADLVWQCSKKLAALLDGMSKNHLTHATMQLDEKFSKDVVSASKELAIRTSVNLLKRFVGVEGETKPEKAKVQRIMDAYERAHKQGKLTKDDFYAAEIKHSWKAMKDYINGKSDYVAIEPTTLSGLDNVLCVGKPKATTTLNGSGEVPEIKSRKEAKAFCLDWARKHLKGKVIYLKEIEKDVRFSMSGIEHAISRGLTIPKALLILQAEDMLKKSKLVRFEEDYKQRKEIKGAYKMTSKAKIKGKSVNVSLTLREGENGVIYYDHDIEVNKKPLSASVAAKAATEKRSKEDSLNKDTKNSRKSNLSGLDNQYEQEQEPVVVSRFSVDLEPEQPEMVQGVEETGIKEETKSDLFTPITAEVADSGHSKIELPTDLGKFLGYVERYEYSILLRGEKGAGKSRMTYQMMNVFAKAGFTVGCFSLEIGKQSNIVRDMRDTYISPMIADRVQIADSAPNGLEDIKAAARMFDVVCIDSWGKIPNVKSDDFDKLRKEFPETMFIVIFQSTTNGTARGGSAPEYDAGIVIQVQSGGRAICEKNRYSGEDLMYLVFQQRLATEEEAAA